MVEVVLIVLSLLFLSSSQESLSKDLAKVVPMLRGTSNVIWAIDDL